MPQAKGRKPLTIPERGPLRGEIKLAAGLDLFAIDITGAVALDVGASTGGFTKTLLERGAEKVYAVDAGFGQLLGSLRQDPRVVNLERVNVAELTTGHVPQAVDFVTVDVSYLSLSEAIEQLSGAVEFAAGARLLGLVKPMFELRLATAPTDAASVDQAIDIVRSRVVLSGWEVNAVAHSPVRGSKGAIEGWVFARRAN